VAPDAALLDMDEWDFHRTLDVNLAGPFFTMQQVGRAMRQQGGGSVVNLISTREASDFSNGCSAYAASRAGLIGLTRAAAGELSAYHIRVNSICYGAGELVLESMSEWDNAAFDRWNRSLPDGSPNNLSRLVKMVLFLCSGAAVSLNGQVISASLLES
jgi:3alpha(or 20beta)-hydroxysteroid dehydrogenase